MRRPEPRRHGGRRPGRQRGGRRRLDTGRARAAGLAVTDEASAVEAAGHAPRLVAGALRNFKVTWPDDFELMEKWL
ncbi:2-C-methyl-D-erythritol 4-phosphate cytidylyltransferase, partial [Bordetella pertussis]|uniref:2-C-methyl-D-erythritol 4-phosphate cytidylyltransferase n=1 Tax=Bordetella pertussis TaxID=520 RepID=UPI000AFCD661